MTRGGSDDGSQCRRLMSELLLQLTYQKQLQKEFEVKSRTVNNATNEMKFDDSTINYDKSEITYNLNSEYKYYDVKDDSNLTENQISSFTRKRPMDCLKTESKVDHNSDDFHRKITGCMSLGDVDESVNKEKFFSLVIIAATNRLEDIDEAIIRRFESRIYVGPPNYNARIQLIGSYLTSITHSLTSKDFDAIAELTYDWSGSDIEKLCRDAAMAPIRSILPFCSNTTNTMNDQTSKKLKIENANGRLELNRSTRFDLTTIRSSDDESIVSKNSPYHIRAVNLSDFRKFILNSLLMMIIDAIDYYNHQRYSKSKYF
jgi:SpoVK/Ycf46/Vps4 family AAA+-type ATPase